MRGRQPEGGFTLVEVLVALVFLTLVAVTFAATTQYASRIVNRSRVELDAQQFLEVETERLRVLHYDSLEDGKRSRGRGIASWSVTDSTSFKQVLLIARFGSPATAFVVDSVILVRRP